jgi:hypothetical protein
MHSSPTRIVCFIALNIHQAKRQRTTPQAKPPQNNAMRLPSRRRRREAPYALTFEYERILRRLMDIAECWKVFE